MGTVQVDYNLPERFDITYVGADNKDHRPVMIHRAPFGSMERFCGLLIEHFAGNFPTWLAPEQVRILPMNDDMISFAENSVQEFSKHEMPWSACERLGASRSDRERLGMPRSARSAWEHVQSAQNAPHRSESTSQAPRTHRTAARTAPKRP